MKPTRALVTLAALLWSTPYFSAALWAGVTNPENTQGRIRSVTVSDIARQRYVDSIEIAPNGKHFAILVRQSDPGANLWRSKWFIGDIRTGKLIPAGDGGEMDLSLMTAGWVSGRDCIWSPDAQWIAYRRIDKGEVQVWRSKVDGSVQEQVTRNAADVADFLWAPDGETLWFRTGEPRAELEAAMLVKDHAGYNYDQDFGAFSDLMHVPKRGGQGNHHLWTVDLANKRESLVDTPSRVAFEATKREREARDAAVMKLAEFAADMQAPGEGLSRCKRADKDRLLCSRQTQTRPEHIVLIGTRSKAVRILADVNPEFANIRFGKVEPIQWDAPIDYAWNRPGGPLAGLAERKKVQGYILYPPNFDPARKYPAIVSPYLAWGFDHASRWEQPLQAYAAAGFVVLNFSFAFESLHVLNKLGPDVDTKTNSAELGFPHLSLYADSTLRGLDAAIRKGFIDPTRIGIGGMSNGALVPLWIVQHHDRFAAMSISSPSWGEFQYYWQTGKLRKDPPRSPWLPKPDHDSEAFYKALDIAENVDAIETPILMNYADNEVFAMLRLMRHMADAQKPYDAWVYRREDHIKVEPAHLASIMNRNLDWFRFWLQDYEDPDPAKAAQYVRWRELRKLQCKNPRSLRDYCGMDK